MVSHQIVFVRVAPEPVSVIPIWVLLIVVILLITFLKAYDLFTFRTSVKNSYTMLALVLVVNVCVIGRTRMWIGDEETLDVDSGSGLSGMNSRMPYIHDVENRSPVFVAGNLPKTVDPTRMYTTESATMAAERLAGGVTTKSAAVLESYGWGKFLYNQVSPRRLNPSWVRLTDGASYRNSNKMPVILMWTTEQHHNSSVSMANGSRHMETGFHCPVTNCIYTDDRSKYMEADAIVFFQMEYHPEYHPLPPRRLPHQRYVFLNRESPLHPYIRHVTNNKTFIQGFYNWTATYRLDSDIHAPYIAFYKRIVTVKARLRSEIMKGKQKGIKIVAWFVSHCKTESRREDYMKELSKYVKVDVWGKCGSYKCGRTHKSTGCYKLLNDYWFYLSFENALCSDYVTEKVLFPMDYADVVPIVYGAANYSKQLPPHSVINVMDFVSPKELSIYLISLMENENKYMEYLIWKEHYRPAYAPHPMCRLCERLNEKHQQGQVYADFTAWWNKDQCDLSWLERHKANW